MLKTIHNLISRLSMHELLGSMHRTAENSRKTPNSKHQEQTTMTTTSELTVTRSPGLPLFLLMDEWRYSIHPTIARLQVRHQCERLVLFRCV